MVAEKIEDRNTILKNHAEAKFIASYVFRQNEQNTINCTNEIKSLLDSAHEAA